MNTYTISEIARITGRSADTLRYYERIGLIDPVRRAANGYRLYNEADLAWLEFLDRLSDTGMPIAGMQRFADLRRQGDSTVTARRELLETHEAELKLRLQQLERGLTAIRDKIAFYKEKEKRKNHDNDGLQHMEYDSERR